MAEDVTESCAAEERQRIQKILAGSKEEFRYLVELHQQRLFAMILRQVGDRSVAHDLTQEVFVRTYTNLSRFRFESSFSTWLIRIALNVTSSYFSSRGYRERKRFVCLEDLEECAEAQREALLDAQAIEHLRAVLPELPKPYRQVLVLCGFEQKSYEEAAHILNIPVGTVRSRLHKARHMLRQLYFEA